MTDPTPALQLRGLNVWFDTSRDRHHPRESHTVRGINLTVAPGERVGLVGESGCGKTTTILAAMGLLPASASVSGEVLLGGENIIAGGEASVRAHRWRDIAMVFQGAMSAFNPVKTIGWQIAEAIEVRGSGRGAGVAERVSELLDLVGLAADTAARYPHQLSGGMKQRAMIAMALACDPKVLLADEPTTALDVVVQDQILKLLVRLCSELNLALVLVTHDLGVIAQSCTRAAVMLEGEIVEEGLVDDLYRRPKHSYTRSLFEATPSLSDSKETDETDAATPALLEVTAIRTVYSTPERRQRRGSPRRRGPERSAAVDGVSLRVHEGELVALVGQSGCGKTTTVQNIMGMVPVQSGSIRIDGAEITKLSGRKWRALRRDVQMIYQDPYESLDVRFRVADTVEEPLLIHGTGGTKAERMKLVHGALADVGLDPERFSTRYPHELSGGQRQRVAIAASLVLRPRLLLADEPVSMLDVSVRTGILELLDRLRREHRMSILMITHDLSTAAKYADRIIVMKDGKVVEEGAPRQIIDRPSSDYTRRLIDSVPNPDPLTHRVV
jgi:peptide/nickel transport system ATP-binding protein